jgi:hypothetical protein
MFLGGNATDWGSSMAQSGMQRGYPVSRMRMPWRESRCAADHRRIGCVRNGLGGSSDCGNGIDFGYGAEPVGPSAGHWRARGGEDDPRAGGAGWAGCGAWRGWGCSGRRRWSAESFERCGSRLRSAGSFERGSKRREENCGEVCRSCGRRRRAAAGTGRGALRRSDAAAGSASEQHSGAADFGRLLCDLRAVLSESRLGGASDAGLA